jgi:glutaredoxin 3
MPANVLIYTTTYCGYCFRAKALLEGKKVLFTEIDVTDRPDLRSWLARETRRSTVPQIFINGDSIGGYDELSALDRKGGLDALLEKEPSGERKASGG